MQTTPTLEGIAASKKSVELALIGGCGSSGTTLLAHVLSRHSAITSAPEIDFFNHVEILNLADLRVQLDALYRRVRLSHGYKLVTNFLRDGDELGIGRDDFEALLDAASDEKDLFRRLAGRIREPAGAACFVEQTPSNVYLFRDLAERFPGLPLIHQIRDGRDVAASFLRRGKTLYHAGSRWLYDTLAGVCARGRESYLELSYEQLVTDSEVTLLRIVEHLGLPFEEVMVNPPPGLTPKNAGKRASYEENWRGRRAPQNWTHVPNEPISSSSIGCFERELSPAQLSTLYRIRLTDAARHELDAPVATFVELLEYLGYETARPKPAAVTFDLRLREKFSEVSDGLIRGARGLKRAHKAVRPLTTVSADFPDAPGEMPTRSG